jgi:hypothetical protein
LRRIEGEAGVTDPARCNEATNGGFRFRKAAVMVDSGFLDLVSGPFGSSFLPQQPSEGGKSARKPLQTNNLHKRFTFLSKGVDSRKTYPYVLASRRRSQRLTAGPGAPGSAGRFDRLCPQRAETLLVITFRGFFLLQREKPAGRFAVLLDLRVLNIVVNREGMRRRWSGKLRVWRKLSTSQ